jgi:hypothetical protein
MFVPICVPILYDDTSVTDKTTEVLPSPRLASPRPTYTCSIWPCLGWPSSLCLSLAAARSPLCKTVRLLAAPSPASHLPARPRAFSLCLSPSLSVSGARSLPLSLSLTHWTHKAGYCGHSVDGGRIGRC